MTNHAGIRRQIVLPTSKAIEIAYKSIRLRLSRSLLVTSGIVLALAFLTSIQTTQALLDSMRGWQAGIIVQRQSAAAQITRAAESVRAAVANEKTPAAAPAQLPAAPDQSPPIDLLALEHRFGQLPIARSQLSRALARSPATRDAMIHWRDANIAYDNQHAIFAQQQSLEHLMASVGVPTDTADIHADNVQRHWILGLALMVAFVGILNSMLMSVTERFREIGTMKCLGALNSFIVKLFLIESLFQGFVGALIGVLLGAFLSLASAMGSFDGFVWKNFPLLDIVEAAAIGLAVGVVLSVAGAVYPAWQAARMQPIDAIRVEA